LPFEIFESLEKQFIYPDPRGIKLLFFAPLGDGVNEEKQLTNIYFSRYS